MSRVIKFRALHGEKKKIWVYGDYVQHSSRSPCIVTEDGIYYHVDPATVGQFTGMLDRDGKEVYEGCFDGNMTVDDIQKR